MKIAATVAAVGTAATVMYAAQDSLPMGNFLAKEMSPMDKEFAAYVAKYRKSYLSTEEYELRSENFAKTHHAIVAHNMSGASHTLAHNHLSDWTEAEKNSMNGYLPRVRGTSGYKFEEVDASKTVDWRKSLASMRVTKDQGQCGSCWAFSTIGSIESHEEIHRTDYISLSEQQLVDCSTWNNGCGGGNFDWAFEYC